MHVWWLISLSVGLMLALILAILALQNGKRHNDALADKLDMVKSELAQTAEQANDSMARLEEYASAISALHQQVQSLQQSTKTIEGVLRETAQQDPQVKLYQRATQLAQQGVTAEDIAKSCDLPFAEASVLVNLHHKAT